MQFNESTYRVSETDRIVQPVLVLNSSTAINFTVHVNITDISATICSDNKTGDYKPETMVVSFKEGTNNALLNISVLDDNLLEDDETFILIIDSSSIPNNVIIEKPSNATVTILNDDGKYIGIPYMGKFWNGKKMTLAQRFSRGAKGAFYPS